MAPRTSRAAGGILAASGLILVALSWPYGMGFSGWPYGMGFVSGWPYGIGFVTGGQAPRPLPRTVRSAFESGSVNLERAVPRVSADIPMLECGEACMAAIDECMSSGCSVEAMLSLDEKLAADEQKVKQNMALLKDWRKVDLAFSGHGMLRWLESCLPRFEALRAELRSAKIQQPQESILAQIGKAIMYPFGFGFRQTDYPALPKLAY
eukprot:TRINITY_DN4845_c0_g1_i8.p1 TRINITY_DN4845_c0_g1~~TRINITY_DN4845_c0_g1_i8.p1  ORF type:complete len:208 (-),score=42.78 TRINITY_DN4845_c0_g1_i8:168-791(-)